MVETITCACAHAETESSRTRPCSSPVRSSSVVRRRSEQHAVPRHVLRQHAQAQAHLAGGLGLQAEAVGGGGDDLLLLEPWRAAQEEGGELLAQRPRSHQEVIHTYRRTGAHITLCGIALSLPGPVRPSPSLLSGVGPRA